jgi:hypothetical protein
MTWASNIRIWPAVSQKVFQSCTAHHNRCLVIMNKLHIWWWGVKRSYMCRTCILTTTNVSATQTAIKNEQNLNIGQDGMIFSRSSTCGHISDYVTDLFNFLGCLYFFFKESKHFFCGFIKILSRIEYKKHFMEFIKMFEIKILATKVHLEDIKILDTLVKIPPNWCFV